MATAYPVYSPASAPGLAQFLDADTCKVGFLQATQMTLGSVVFAGASGLLSQDNANFFWDATNKRLGIGVAATPLYTLHVLSSADVPAGYFIRPTTATTTISTPVWAEHRTTGDMADGFGCAIGYEIRDGAGVSNAIGSVGAVREGADNSGALVFNVYVAGVGTERVRIKNNGYVGINTTTPETTLHVKHAAGTAPVYISHATTDIEGARIRFEKFRGTIASPTTVVTGDTLMGLTAWGYDGSALVSSANITAAAEGTIATGQMPGVLIFRTSTTSTLTERMRINSVGKFLVGATNGSAFQFSTNEGQTTYGYLTLDVANSTAEGALINTWKSRGTLASRTAVQNNDALMEIMASCYTGGSGGPPWQTGLNTAGAISIYADGTISANISPGRIVFFTCPTTGGAVLERMRITAAGNVGIGATSPAAKLHLRKGAGAGGDVSDSNSICQFDSDTNATNFWFNGKTSGAGGTNMTFGFATAGTVRHGITYNTAGNWLALTHDGGNPSPTAGLFVDSASRIGIGTASPSANYSLTVSGRVTITADPSTYPCLQVNATDGGACLQLKQTDAAHSTILDFQGSDSATKAQFGYSNFAGVPPYSGNFWLGQLATGSKFVIITAGDAAAFSVNQADGKVGINTSSPDHLLDVRGDFSVKTHSAFAGSEFVTKTAAVQTTDATATLIFNQTLNDNTLYWFEVCIIGRDTSGTDRAYYTRTCYAYRQGGGAAVGNIVALVNEETADWNVTIAPGAVNVNDIEIKVVGASTTINWAATVKFQAVSGNT